MSPMTPTMRARLETFKSIRVAHPRLEEVDRAVRRSIWEHASYTQLMLYGPTGVGKSTVASHITEHCLASEPNRAIVPVVLVEAHPSDIGSYARLDYYRQVLTQLRQHAAVKDRLMPLALQSTPRPGRTVRDVGEWLELREAVEYALMRLQVQAVFIDEAQHLMRVEAPLKPVDQLDWLKSMTNTTKVLHILVGNYELYDFRNLNGQAARRGRDLHFPRYHADKKSECEEFVGALRYVLERVPLICDVDELLLHWRWFLDWSVGCIGILRDWVVDTVAALCDEGATTLTIDALHVAALQPDQRVRLEREARAGEHKVEVGKTTSHQQLQELLGPVSQTPERVTPSARVGERASRGSAT
jgi:energy-coupling factor transporter ATP-binding protein EcfA2